jgi:tetratricopeptide (TPR) repeat protein
MFLKRGMLVLCVLALTASLQAQTGRVSEPTLDSLRTRAAADVNDPVAHYDLAMAYWEKKQWDDSEKELHTAVAIAPAYAEAYLALSAMPKAKGEKYWKKRIKSEGETVVREAFVQGNSNYRHAFLLNPLVDLGVLGRFEAQDRVAFVVKQKYVVVLVPPWWSDDVEKGINDFRQGRYDVAFNRLQKLIADRRLGGDTLAPNPVLWYHGLAAAHLANFDAAIRDFAVLTGRAVANEKARAEPDALLPLLTNDYRYILATMLYLAGRFDDAIPTFKRTLEFDPGLYVSHVQLARIYSAARLWDDAIHEREAAVDANAEDSGLYLELGATLLQAGRTAEAQEPLQRAETMNPRDSRIPYMLGLVLTQVGNEQEARRAYQRFLDIAPSTYGSQIEEVRGRLASAH